MENKDDKLKINQIYPLELIGTGKSDNIFFNNYKHLENY